MATQRVAPDAILALTNLTGLVSAIQDDPDAPDSNWLLVSDNTLSTECYVSFPTPLGSPTGGALAQEIRALVRRLGGANNPTARIEVWANGVQQFLGTDTTISTNTVLSLLWTYGPGFAAGNGADVEVKVIGTASGGSPSKRATVGVGAIEWNAVYTQQGTTTPLTLAATSTFTPSLSRLASFKRTFAVASTFGPSLSRRLSLLRTFAVSTPMGAAVQRRVDKTISVASTFGPTLFAQKVLLKTFAVGSQFTATLSERLVMGRVLAATTTLTPTIRKTVLKTLNVGSALTVGFQRKLYITLAVGSAFGVELRRLVKKTFAIGSTFQAVLADRYTKILNFSATTSLSPSLVATLVANTGKRVKRFLLALMGVD